MAAHHTFRQRIYVQHTDMWGIVYYANYFSMAEHARAEFFRDKGLPLHAFTREHQGYFVVTQADGRFLKPARLDDCLEILTHVTHMKKASLTLSQDFMHTDHGCLARLMITLAWLSDQGRPTALPPILEPHLA
ncbi:YbgC/FadM family acyl-CoA thioesterase [Candidatus Hepatobacter penaei]|uniref:YbgC/FadM family acyl-CoA thioesterase n=1 Tax=Candidatus Hepatobacter penaei TaxID=1274402 RepID=UPI0004F28B0D|nr:YbgC/FadM family acyl-CoA thioesterase [Candidatus Hepatobacter penaei]TGW15811.1 YbgC/FadM family acyl-CoA thioesterase [bacterium NHP-B]